MKSIFLFFACTCLLSGLSALNFPLEGKNFNAEIFESAFENGNDDDLENSFLENKEQNLIDSHPGFRPTPPSTTTTTTTTTVRPSTTPRPRPTRPTPPRPTTRPTPPRPTTRPTPPKPNPQVYENTVRGLGPFASQLINIVLNREDGKQKTVQRNDILYNFRGMRANRDLDDEE